MRAIRPHGSSFSPPTLPHVGHAHPRFYSLSPLSSQWQSPLSRRARGPGRAAPSPAREGWQGWRGVSAGARKDDTCVSNPAVCWTGASLPVLEQQHLSSPRQTTNEIDALPHVALGEQLRPRFDGGRSRAGTRRPHSPHSPPSLPAAAQPARTLHPPQWSSASLHLAV